MASGVRCGRLCALIGSGLIACTGPASDDATGDATTPDAATTAPSPTSGTGDETTGGADTTSAAPDVGDPSGSACDLVAQDCPPQHKCMPVFVLGTGFVAQCAPLDADPLAPGDVCPLSSPLVPTMASDPCDGTSVCMSTGGDPMTGECVPMCPAGDADCRFADQVCVVAYDGALRVCAPTCDPLASECPAGTACYPSPPVLDRFTCAPVLPWAGGYGTPCDDVQLACLPGHGCFPGTAACGAESCCTPWCSVRTGAPCPGAGELCSVLDAGAPPDLVDVGVCVMP